MKQCCECLQFFDLKSKDITIEKEYGNNICFQCGIFCVVCKKLFIPESISIEGMCYYCLLASDYVDKQTNENVNQTIGTSEDID